MINSKLLFFLSIVTGLIETGLGQNTSSCLFNNQLYSNGETIPDPIKICNICFCREGEIDCTTVIECAPLFGITPKGPDCYLAYAHGRCCGVEICTSQLSPGDVRLSKCQYANETYRYGERILLAENVCKTCICDENWNVSDPESSQSCRDTACEDPGPNQNCVPIFIENRCCPVDFVCKGSSSSCSNRLSDSSKFCWFTGKQRALGESVQIKQACTALNRVCANCQCQMPPLMTCLYKEC